LDAIQEHGRRPRNIVLVGFMGTGKTSVSRLLADRLGYRAVDTDEEIERRAGKTIAEIFAAEGEGRFRDMETQVLRDTLAVEGQVVATGGGAVLREENRRLMLAAGWVVALMADPETLAARLARPAEAGVRPLLAGDVMERVRSLIEARKHAYDFAHCMIDTSRRTPEEIAGLLMRWMV